MSTMLLITLLTFTLSHLPDAFIQSNNSPCDISGSTVMLWSYDNAFLCKHEGRVYLEWHEGE